MDHIVASKKIEVSVPVIYVSDTNKELRKLCQKFYDYPDKKLEIFIRVLEYIEDIKAYLQYSIFLCSPCW